MDRADDTGNDDDNNNDDGDQDNEELSESYDRSVWCVVICVLFIFYLCAILCAILSNPLVCRGDVLKSAHVRHANFSTNVIRVTRCFSETGNGSQYNHYIFSTGVLYGTSSAWRTSILTIAGSSGRCEISQSRRSTVRTRHRYCGWWTPPMAWPIAGGNRRSMRSVSRSGYFSRANLLWMIIKT